MTKKQVNTIFSYSFKLWGGNETIFYYFNYFFPLMSVHAVLSEVKASRRLLGPRPDE